MSETGKYVIPTKESHILYTDSTASPHPWLKRSTDKIIPAPNGRTYYPYVYSHILDPNDCLQFAESLTLGEIGYKGTRCILKEKGSSLLFGYSDARNIDIALRRGEILNEKANPNIGESYAIVRHAVIEGKAPYHIAYVMFKDGSTNITLEADAGDPTIQHPVFDMYSTNTPKQSFHARYIKDYSPASTVILTRR